MGTIIILGLLAIFVILFFTKGFKIIQQSETMVIERFGKYNRTLDPGINLLWPVVDRPIEIMWRFYKEGLDGKNIFFKTSVDKIDLRETVYDFPKQNVYTKDNVLTEINAILYFQIIDPVKSVYEISDLPDAIEKITQTTLRNVIGSMNLEDALTSRDTTNGKLRAAMDEVAHRWGVRVNRVELHDINPPRDIREAMERQIHAERDKRAIIHEAEGEKQSQILKAEGEAQARIIKAEGEAEAIQKIAQAVTTINGDPVSYLLGIRYIDSLKEMASGKDNKVIYIPYGTVGALNNIQDLFSK